MIEAGFKVGLSARISSKLLVALLQMTRKCLKGIAILLSQTEFKNSNLKL